MEIKIPKKFSKVAKEIAEERKAIRDSVIQNDAYDKIERMFKDENDEISAELYSKKVKA